MPLPSVRPPPADVFVNAAPTRRRIRELLRAGVGYKTVAERSGLGKTAVFEILSGRSRKVRRSTADAIAGVAAVPRGSVLVGAEPTWQLLDALLDLGYAKSWIARMLGAKARRDGGTALQLRRTRVTAISAARVQRLYAHVWRSDMRLRELVQGRLATDVSPQSKLAAFLRKMDPAEFAMRISRFENSDLGVTA